MISYFFILLAVIALASALAMVINRNTVNSALFLVLNMVSLAGIYVLLKAQFLAIIQIIVYAGAIMVLFLFVIMLLNIDLEESLFSKIRIKYFAAFIFGAVIFSFLLYSIGNASDMLPQISSKTLQIGRVQAVGKVLFSHYLLPFELTAILLTAAVVGALLIAQHKVNPSSHHD